MTLKSGIHRSKPYSLGRLEEVLKDVEAYICNDVGNNDGYGLHVVYYCLDIYSYI